MVEKFGIIPEDTRSQAAAVQIAALRKMSTAERAEMTFQLSNNLREITEAGIRQRHPDYNREQVTAAVLKMVLDKDTFRKIFPHSRISV